jgi:hypothetical protein
MLCYIYAVLMIQDPSTAPNVLDVGTRYVTDVLYYYGGPSLQQLASCNSWQQQLLAVASCHLAAAQARFGLTSSSKCCCLGACFSQWLLPSCVW